MKAWVRSLFFNIRFYVLLFNFILAMGIYLYVTVRFKEGEREIILVQTYSLLALSFLYMTLLAGPLTKIFTKLPFRGKYLKARRALGVSTFLFASMHARAALFDYLGGPLSVFSLDNRYKIAITLSSIAFIILLLMAATSFDYMVTKLTFQRWKMLHRFVYFAGIFIIIHAILIGSHFNPFSGVVPTIFTIALAFLLTLEGVGVKRMLDLKKRLQQQSNIQKTPS